MEKLVFVQADCQPEQGLDEARWVSDLAQRDSRLQGVVAFAPLEQETVEAYLEKLQAYPLVKGVRRLIQSEGPGFCNHNRFVAGVRALALFGYTFDIYAFHNQLADVLRLVEWVPEVNFVLDHLGKPDVKSSDMERWRENITRLAQFDNVYCKLSGMITEVNSPSVLQPYIDHVLASFGAERVMFGGDYPMVELAPGGYVGWVQLALEALASRTDAERQHVFYNTAARFYRLD